MIVTSTELQNNFGKYVNIIKKEPVAFTKNGKIAGKLVAVKKDKLEAFENLERIKQGLHDLSNKGVEICTVYPFTGSSIVVLHLKNCWWSDKFQE